MLTYSQAISETDKEKWKKAIKEEKQSMLQNKVWKVIKQDELPNGKKPLTTK